MESPTIKKSIGGRVVECTTCLTVHSYIRQQTLNSEGELHPISPRGTVGPHEPLVSTVVLLDELERGRVAVAGRRFGSELCIAREMHRSQPTADAVDNAYHPNPVRIPTSRPPRRES